MIIKKVFLRYGIICFGTLMMVISSIMMMMRRREFPDQKCDPRVICNILVESKEKLFHSRKELHGIFLARSVPFSVFFFFLFKAAGPIEVHLVRCDFRIRDDNYQLSLI